MRSQKKVMKKAHSGWWGSHFHFSAKTLLPALITLPIPSLKLAKPVHNHTAKFGFLEFTTN